MVNSEILIIGSGLAGLFLAKKLSSKYKVQVICKKQPSDTNTAWAQGGIASVLDPNDNFANHINDTIKTGTNLCDEQIVKQIIEKGPSIINDLFSLGARFDMQGSKFKLGKEGGHSFRRIVHHADTTGAEVQRALLRECLENPNINIKSEQTAIDLIKNDSGEAIGAYVFCKRTNSVLTYKSNCTILATGGAGKVYLYSTNPDVATGDGIAMAYRAGCKVRDMEFFQFHPTCLYNPKAKSFLLTEAMRGEGAKLLNSEGKEFMHKYHELGELAPRDIVARAIDFEMKSSGAKHVYLDISHKPASFILERFPKIHQITKSYGIDITQSPAPVVPAAHYCVGGVETNLIGQTNIKNLFVIGESASTGLHGANRLASNSLLEAAVMADELSEYLIKHPPKPCINKKIKPWDYLNTQESRENVLIKYHWREVRGLMWNLLGIVRTDKRLLMAKKRLELIENDIRDYYWKYTISPDLLELRNITLIAKLVTECALQRKESRGLHYNLDHPNTAKKAFHSVDQKNKKS